MSDLDRVTDRRAVFSFFPSCLSATCCHSVKCRGLYSVPRAPDQTAVCAT